MTEPITDIPLINLVEQFREQLVSQYQNSTNFNKLFIDVILPQFEELQVVIFQLLDLRQLDVAEGAQLNIIGIIVGIERYFINDPSDGLFGFTDVPGYIGFNDTDGGVWLNSPTQDLVPIPDDQYRSFIKAKIFKNQMNYTLSDMETLAQITFDDPMASATIPSSLLTRITFSIALTVEQKYLLMLTTNSETGNQLIPPPAGTNIEYYDTNGFIGAF